MRLRIVDAGTVTAVRSQSLWHGIASAMDGEAEPTLSFCRPGEPYVCLGYHRPLEEVDRRACREMGLAVIRRQIGGGTVYNDGDQLFFQITLPARRAPARVDRLYEICLAPALEAFRELGLAARIRGLNDISVGDRRISGTGAGRIGEAVTVVGNVIFRFPHERMVAALALPSDRMRRECLRLMKRHVSSFEEEGLPKVGIEQVKGTLVRAFSRSFGAVAGPEVIGDAEEREIEGWEKRFARPDWLAGPLQGWGLDRDVRNRPQSRQVKICAGVWVYHARRNGLCVQASVVDGRIEGAAIEAAALDGAATRMSRALEGVGAEPKLLAERLTGFGKQGREVLDLLRAGLVLR